MFSINMFLNNIRYLGRYNIKKIHRRFEDVYYSIDHIQYEIENDLAKNKKVKIHNIDETIDKLINSNCSMSRFGDGELAMIFGGDICFQKKDAMLSKRLKEVLLSDDENLLIGIPRLYDSLWNVNFYSKQSIRKFFGRNNDRILSLLNEEKDYYSADFTQQYVLLSDYVKETFDFENYFNKIRCIWDNKDITIVCGDRVFNNIENNIFDNAKSIEYIYAPTVNAFDSYDDILNKLIKTDKNKIIFIILGPTASVLVYDLAKSGFRAIDIGHVAKDYDAYRKNVPVSDKTLVKFFGND